MPYSTVKPKNLSTRGENRKVTAFITQYTCKNLLLRKENTITTLQLQVVLRRIPLLFTGTSSASFRLLYLYYVVFTLVGAHSSFTKVCSGFQSRFGLGIPFLYNFIQLYSILSQLLAIYTFNLVDIIFFAYYLQVILQWHSLVYPWLGWIVLLEQGDVEYIIDCTPLQELQFVYSSPLSTQNREQSPKLIVELLLRAYSLKVFTRQEDTVAYREFLIHPSLII